MYTMEIEQQRYNEFKQNIKDNYDYISSLDIARLNKQWGRPVTLQQCVQINKELYGE